MPKRITGLARANPKLRSKSNFVGRRLGFENFDIADAEKKLPSGKKILATTVGASTLGGAASGAAGGANIGVGMNDRQYLMGRDIKPNEVVKNSTMASLQMNGSGAVSNLSAQGFGKVVGSLHRNNFTNTKDNSLKTKSEFV